MYASRGGGRAGAETEEVEEGHKKVDKVEIKAMCGEEWQVGGTRRSKQEQALTSHPEVLDQCRHFRYIPIKTSRSKAPIIPRPSHLHPSVSTQSIHPNIVVTLSA